VKREFQRDEGCGVGEEEPLSTTEVPVLACGLPDIGGGVGGGRVVGRVLEVCCENVRARVAWMCPGRKPGTRCPGRKPGNQVFISM